MRVKRVKAVKTTLQWYSKHWNFKPPYSVILDASFVALCAEKKMDPMDKIRKLLQAPTDPSKGQDKSYVRGIVCDPLLEAMQKLNCRDKLVLKNKDIRMINRTSGLDMKGSIGMSAEQAIHTLVGSRNAGRYIVATQNNELRTELHRLHCVPMLFYDPNRFVFRLSTPPNLLKKTAANTPSRLPTPKIVSVDESFINNVREKHGLPTLQTEKRNKRKAQQQKVKEFKQQKEKKQRKKRELMLASRTAEEKAEAKRDKRRRKNQRKRERLAAQSSTKNLPQSSTQAPHSVPVALKHDSTTKKLE